MAGPPKRRAVSKKESESSESNSDAGSYTGQEVESN